MTRDEALLMAIEAIKNADYHNDLQAITALKEALAQPWEKFCDSNCIWTDHHPDCKLAEQEPVAWMHIQGRHKELSHCPLDDGEISRGWEQYPLYTTPPQRTWVGLTQDEQDKIFKTFSKSDAYKRDFLNRIASAIEAKLKEKNT